MRWRGRGRVTPAQDGARAIGLTWSETFKGCVAFGQSDFNQSLLPQYGEPATAALTVAIPDLRRFLAAQSDGGIRDREALPAQVTSGYVRCDAFGGELSVRSGTFEAFVPAGASEPRDALHLRMRYDLQLAGPGGRAYALQGFKLMENDPGYDSWSDSTTLFIRIAESAGGEPVAIGVLRISPLAFTRELLTFRGTGPSRWRRIEAVARYQCFFADSMIRTYWGPPVSGARPSFPRDRVEPPWAPRLERPTGPLGAAATSGTAPLGAAATSGTAQPAFAPMPGTSLGRAIVEFAAPDLDFPLNLHRLRRLDPDGRPQAPTRGPVLLVPGSGVRAEMYYGQPVGLSCAEYLLNLGYDVWVESWRASIDLPPNPYTLDHAALFDHPKAVQTILDVCDGEAGGGAGNGGGTHLKAVVHCQGSIGFMMAAVAGRIDERVTHIVSSAVSVFVDVTQSTWLKQRLAMPLVAGLFTGLDAQWGIRPVTPSAGLFASAAKRMERRCGNPTCQVANFMYGSGWDVLFRHVDDHDDPWVADAVHEWAGREVGYTPLSLIRQVAESSRHGYIVPSASPPPGTPAAYLATPPQTRAQITFMAGDHNNMFRWQGQRRAKEFFDEAAGQGQADFVVLPGYGHLDTFWARTAPDHSFKVIAAGLEWEHGQEPPSVTTSLPTVGEPLPPRRGRIFSRSGPR